MQSTTGPFDSSPSRPVRAAGTGRPDATTDDRPFGVHIRVSRWKSVLVIVAVPLLLLVVQIIVFQGVVAIEGPADPLMPRLTPLSILASGISTAITALLATMMLARLAKVPWRSVFRHGRPFDRRRLGIYLAVAAVLVAVALAAASLFLPETLGNGNISIGAVTIASILVTLVATPLQSAGEEIAFRGVVVPAAGSWFRAVGPALVLAVLVSGATFAVVHVSIEPWFVSYLFVFSACTVLMGAISGGLEAAMAFHVSNNVIAGIFNAVMAGNDSAVVNRGEGTGSAGSFIILMVMNVAVLGAVWLIERRRRTVRRSTAH